MLSFAPRSAVVRPGVCVGFFFSVRGLVAHLVLWLLAGGDEGRTEGVKKIHLALKADRSANVSNVSCARTARDDFYASWAALVSENSFRACCTRDLLLLSVVKRARPCDFQSLGTSDLPGRGLCEYPGLFLLLTRVSVSFFAMLRR